MVRLGLKLFYLRTRERKLSQKGLALLVGVRQATLSAIETGLSLPSAPVLLELARFFDVTPTFLLDDERGPLPLPSERWSMRNALVTAGMWIEAPKDAVVDLGDGRLLCPLAPGCSFFDEEAYQVRRSNGRDGDEALAALFRSRQKLEGELAQALAGELQTHPRRRGKAGEPDGEG